MITILSLILLFTIAYFITKFFSKYIVPKVKAYMIKYVNQMCDNYKEAQLINTLLVGLKNGHENEVKHFMELRKEYLSNGDDRDTAIRKAIHGIYGVKDDKYEKN